MWNKWRSIFRTIDAYVPQWTQLAVWPEENSEVDYKKVLMNNTVNQVLSARVSIWKKLKSFHLEIVSGNMWFKLNLICQIFSYINLINSDIINLISITINSWLQKFLHKIVSTITQIIHSNSYTRHWQQKGR